MKILKMFSKTKSLPQDDFLQKSTQNSERDANVHRYPPFDRGFPVDPVDKIIQSQAHLIDKIKVAIGMSQTDFDKYVMTVIKNYANYIHLLPATSNEHHKGAGGLFRLGLEVAFYSSQSASGIIFSGRESSEKRKVLQPKWCYATFIAGLCCELYRPITSMVVVDRDGNEWPQLLIPLTSWLNEKKIDRYYIRWNESINGIDAVQRHSNAAYLLNRIIPQECLQYMNAEGGQVITAMTATITGAARSNTGNILYDLVIKAYENTVTHDIKSNPELYGKFTVGAHMEPHVIDAMRTLYSTQKWQVNQKGGRLWYSVEGLFCIWTPATKEIRQYMLDHNLTGIPENEDTLAEVLMNGSLLMPNKAGGPYWDIVLPESGKLLKAVRMIDPSILMFSDTEKQIDFSLINGTVLVKEPSDQIKEVAKDSPKESNSTEVNATTEQKHAEKPSEANKPLSNVQNIKPAEAANHVSKPASSELKGNVPDAVGNRGPLFETLTEDSRLLLGAILDDYLDGSSDFPVFYCAEGLAISIDEFRGKGQSEIPVIKEIGNRAGSSKRWLVTESGSSKQTMSLKYNNDTIECFVLNLSVAKGLGFPPSPTKGK